jgi:hypothetical protein
MKKIIALSFAAFLMFTGCAVHTSPMVSFNTEDVNFGTTYKKAEDCRLKIPLVEQLTTMVAGPQGLDVRGAAVKNGMSKIKYYEIEDSTFKTCYVYYGE